MQPRPPTGQPPAAAALKLLRTVPRAGTHRLLERWGPRARALDSHPAELPLFTHSHPGVVIAPWAPTVLCAYSRDGGTLQRTCSDRARTQGSCSPGCNSRGLDAPTDWCGPGDVTSAAAHANHTLYPCAWPVERLDQMLRMFFHGNDRYHLPRCAPIPTSV